MVWIRSSPFLMGILLMIVTFYFRRAADISFVADANSLLRITPLKVLSLSCRYALHLVLGKLFIFRLFFSLPPASHLDKQIYVLYFPYVFNVDLVAITFSIKKEKKLAE